MLDRWLGPAVIGSGVVIPRDALEGTPYNRVDLRLTKTLRLGNSLRASLMAEVFNVFNYANYTAFNTAAQRHLGGDDVAVRPPDCRRRLAPGAVRVQGHVLKGKGQRAEGRGQRALAFCPSFASGHFCRRPPAVIDTFVDPNFQPPARHQPPNRVLRSDRFAGSNWSRSCSFFGQLP